MNSWNMYLEVYLTLEDYLGLILRHYPHARNYIRKVVEDYVDPVTSPFRRLTLDIDLAVRQSHLDVCISFFPSGDVSIVWTGASRLRPIQLFFR